MLTYFITLQFLDAVTNRLGFILTIWVGIILIMVGALFVCPIDFLPQFLICIILGLAMIGASGAAINVPCLMEMGRLLKKDDPSIDEFLGTYNLNKINYIFREPRYLLPSFDIDPFCDLRMLIL